MNLDISTAVQTAFYLIILIAIISIWIGYRSIRAGQKLLFFRKRQQLIWRGRRSIFYAILLLGLAFMLNRFAEPVIYQVFPPSPTVTNTPTETATATITLSPTVTLTPTITPTTSITPTPFVPTEIFMQFTATVTANPDAVFSSPQFSLEINQDDFQPIEPGTTFANPIRKVYATFSFDKMNTGAQWTALWVRLSDNRIICAESAPWAAGTGGYAYSLCEPSPDKWLAGEYEFHMFTGTTYKITGRFSITGDPPTSTPTLTPTTTNTPTFTPIPTSTPTPPPPTWTPTATVPSATPVPSWTPTPTVPTATRAPSWTPTPTIPTATHAPTWTVAPNPN